MTVAVTTLNNPRHASTAHKRLPVPLSDPTPSSNGVGTSTSTTATFSTVRPNIVSSSSSRHIRTTWFHAPRLYRITIAVLLLATLAFALWHVPVQTVRLVIASFVPAWLRVRLSRATFAARRSMRTMLHSYQRQLHLRPMTSRAVTAGIIFCFADILAQLLTRPAGRKSFTATFSFWRVVRYALFGLLFIGPVLYVWYDMMNQFGPPDDVRGSVFKSIFEELTLEPVCIATYIVYDGVLTGKPYRLISRTIRTKLVPLWFNNSAFWLPANFANYYIGTPDMRVIFANLCSLFWNVYFSAKVNRIPGYGHGEGAVLPTTASDTAEMTTSASTHKVGDATVVELHSLPDPPESPPSPSKLKKSTSPMLSPQAPKSPRQQTQPLVSPPGLSSNGQEHRLRTSSGLPRLVTQNSLRP